MRQAGHELAERVRVVDRGPRLARRAVSSLRDERVGELAFGVRAHDRILGEAADDGRGLAHAVEHGERLAIDRDHPRSGRAQVIEHRRLLLLRHAIAGVEAREQRGAVGSTPPGGRWIAIGRGMSTSAARGLGGFLGDVLALEPIEVVRRQVRRELRVRRHRAEHVLEDRERRGHVAVRPRTGRAVVAALADAAERQLRAREVRRAVAVEHAARRARANARTAPACR